MFHITNKVYLQYDYAFSNKTEYLVASSTWGSRALVNTDLSAPETAESFDNLITNTYGGDRENFWTALLSKENKFVAYLDPETLTALQVQYWRSIFTNISVADLHRLHNAWIDTTKLSNRFNPIGNYDPETNTWNRHNADNALEYKTLEEITVIYNANTPSVVLQAIDKNKVSFEYLLADYYADNTSPYATELLKRVEFIVWDNWADEVDHLRYEIMSFGLDVDNIDTNLTVDAGSVITQIQNSSALSWVLNPQYGNIDYLKENYDHDKVMSAYDAIFTIPGYEWEENHLRTLSLNIVAGNFATILTDDINRGTGSMFSKERFANKMNQIFLSWVYRKVRGNATADLSGYQLRR